MISVLHVDDDRFDLELVQFKLERVDKEIHIESESSADSALQRMETEEFDAVLCDFQMPEMNGLELLRKLRDSGKNTPFIFLTGQGNERLAVEALHAGADDYFTKEESLAHYERLVHSLRNRVKIQKKERDQLRMERALNAIFTVTHPKTDREFLDSLLLKLAEILNVEFALICELDQQDDDIVRTLSFVSGGKVVENVMYGLSGTPCEKVVSRELCIFENDLQNNFPKDHMLVEMKAVSYIGLPLFKRDGSPLGHVAILDTKPMVQTSFMTALLRALSVRVSAEIERMSITRDLAESERQLRSVIESMISGFALHEMIPAEEGGKVDFRYLQINQVFEELMGFTADDAYKKTIRELFPGIEEFRIDMMAEVVTTGKPLSITNYVDVFDRHLDVRFYKPGPGLCATIFNDVSEKVEAEEALKKSEKRFRDLFGEMMSGAALHEIVCDDNGEPVDYRFLEINEAFEKLTGLKATETIGKCVREVIPGIEDFWIETYGRVALTGQPTQFSNINKVLDRIYEIRAYCPTGGTFAVVFNDITDQVFAEKALRKSEKKFRSLVELNVAAIFRSTLDGQLLECNEALLQMLGYSTFEEIAGNSLVDTYIQATDRMSLMDDLKQFGALKNKIIRLRTTEGKTIECLLNVQLLDNNHLLGTMVEVNDSNLVEI